MLTVILIITFISIAMLCIGFFEIRIPFLSIPSYAFKRYKVLSRNNKHTRKIQHKKLWKDQTHKGFIELSA